jgi:SAM-dependent methyltransferase
VEHSARERLARELHGHGVEFGPGCHPLKVGPSVSSIRYCDAHDRASFAAAFPEVKETVGSFPDPVHFRLHFDREPFAERIGRGTLDFVVANHVLEHLVNPIQFLEQCYDVLADGGLLFLGLPDKRWIFDRDRRRTPLQDVVVRYEAGVTDLTDERIAEFVNQVEHPDEPLLPGAPAQSFVFEWHRSRSVHVNVWLLDDIIELFLYLGRRRMMYWALHDGVVGGNEFLLLFRKSDRPEVPDLYAQVLARLHAEAARGWVESGIASFMEQLTRLEEQVGETARFVRGLKRMAGAVPGGETVRRWVRKGGR